MAYSKEIIQIVKDKVAAIATSLTLTSVPAFYTREVWDFNQLTDATYPLVILDRPIEESGKILAQGNPQKSYNLFIYVFAGTIEVNAEHETYKEPLLIVAEEIVEKLLKGLSNARVAGIGNVDYIKTYRTTEIPEFNKLDSNPVGLMLNVQIVFTSLKSLC